MVYGYETQKDLGGRRVEVKDRLKTIAKQLLQENFDSGSEISKLQTAGKCNCDYLLIAIALYIVSQPGNAVRKMAKL